MTTHRFQYRMRPLPIDPSMKKHGKFSAGSVCCDFKDAMEAIRTSIVNYDEMSDFIIKCFLHFAEPNKNHRGAKWFRTGLYRS